MWRIAVCSTCIVISVATIAWWEHKKITRVKSIEAATTSRTRAEHGETKAQLDLGTRYYYGLGVPRDYSEAARWYRKAADQGDANAQFDLSSMYYAGKGVPQSYPEALDWCRKAAEQGDSKAESALGYAYSNGEGVPQDYSAAVVWYRKAAEQGYPLAQQALGYMYANGQGVPQDDTRAVEWYRRAADHGDEEAQQSLGYMYASGRGVQRDYGEAAWWYRKAADQGNAKAKQALKLLESRSRPPTKTQFVEISTALLGFPVGLWLSLNFLLPGRKLSGWRPAITLLGVIFLLNAGLSLYAFAHDIRYSPYHDAFHLARKILVTAAILIIVTIVLPVKQKPKAQSGLR